MWPQGILRNGLYYPVPPGCMSHLTYSALPTSKVHAFHHVRPVCASSHMWKWPSIKTYNHLIGRLDFISLVLEFLHVPVCPYKSAMRELRLG
jgi:hypothetical protein